jgi:16S rRNA (adenine1518-N6/adenine1519-N6)-dimethyltransferase
MTKRKNIKKLENEEHFFKLVRDSFKFKRKNLRNNLKAYDLEKINEKLSEYNLDTTVRAEQLSIERFIEISNFLSK